MKTLGVNIKIENSNEKSVRPDKSGDIYPAQLLLFVPQ
jgi:hypothetical protein